MAVQESTAFKLMLSLLTAAILYLSTTVIQSKTEIALLQQDAAAKEELIEQNQQTVREALETLGKLDKTLSILNDRLKRPGTDKE